MMKNAIKEKSHFGINANSKQTEKINIVLRPLVNKKTSLKIESDKPHEYSFKKATMREIWQVDRLSETKNLAIVHKHGFESGIPCEWGWFVSSKCGVFFCCKLL